MCEAVEKYGKDKVVENVKALMETMKWTLKQAWDDLKVQDKDRPYIV